MIHRVDAESHLITALPSPLGIVTPQRLLAAIGFTVDDARKGLVRTRQALNARTPRITTRFGNEYGGDPDHRIRLEAARMIYELAGLTNRKREDEADPGRPVAVQIIVHPPSDASTQRGVTLTIGSGAPLPVVEGAQKSSEVPEQELFDLG